MEEDGVLSDDQLTCLLRIRQTVNTAGLWIPGPLVPYFEALTLSCGAYAHQGNVSPRLPETLAAIPANHLVYDDDFKHHLPNLPAILDQLYTSGQYSSAELKESNVQASSIKKLFGVTPTAATTQFQNILSGPTFRSTQFMPLPALERYVGYYTLLSLPNFSGNLISTAPATWSQMLGIEPLYPGQPRSWITHVSTVMQTYCTHFNGSRSLLNITKVGIGAGSVEVTYTGTAVTEISANATFVDTTQAAGTVAAVNAHYLRAPVNTFTAATVTHNPNVPNGTYQLASLARTNARLSGTADNKVGPIWSNRPVFKQSTEAYDYLVNLAPHIASYYHSATPVKR
jgi:hypothetical protein